MFEDAPPPADDFDPIPKKGAGGFFKKKKVGRRSAHPK